jgi:hypothetical protein
MGSHKKPLHNEFVKIPIGHSVKWFVVFRSAVNGLNELESEEITSITCLLI